MAPITQADNLIEQLANLPWRDYADLIREVDAKRRKALVDQDGNEPPGAGAGKEEFARWVGRQNHLTDPGIRRVFYLPRVRPANEVRLLEVNDLAVIPERAPIVAIPFRTDIEGIDYRLFVADVTPRQYEALLNREIPLPKDWSLEGSEEIAPPVP